MSFGGGYDFPTCEYEPSKYFRLTVYMLRLGCRKLSCVTMRGVWASLPLEVCRVWDPGGLSLLLVAVSIGACALCLVATHMSEVCVRDGYAFDFPLSLL